MISKKLTLNKKNLTAMNPDIFTKLPNKNQPWFVQLHQLLSETLDIFSSLNEKQAELSYAPTKWTLKELLDHLTECEKIFHYRALRFSKKEYIELPGFDENLFVQNGNANRQSLTVLLEELKLTRYSTLCFFGKLSEKELATEGIANGQTYSIEYIAEHIAEHHAHHLQIIKERYLPLL